MVSYTIVTRSYLHISYLASTWFPGLYRELAELAVQPSVLEQNAGRKEEMGQGGCCKSHSTVDQSRHFEGQRQADPTLRVTLRSSNRNCTRNRAKRERTTDRTVDIERCERVRRRKRVEREINEGVSDLFKGPGPIVIFPCWRYP
jgi:hypothetical protein